MATLITDPTLEDRLRTEREESGADRFDEAWEGVYVMPPLADDEHQDIQTKLGAILQLVVGWSGAGQVRTGVNVSDREEGWERNFRIPDLAVFLIGGAARNCGTHWRGGPDFAVEIISANDRTREKLPFYEHIAVRELLLIDRDPWGLELYRLQNGMLDRVGQTIVGSANSLTSLAVPLSFRLLSDAMRPRIELIHADGKQRWIL